MFKRILTLGMAGGKSDIEVLLDTVKPYMIEPRIGYSKKEMEKCLVSLLGKNFENVVYDFDNMFEICYWRTDKLATFEQQFNTVLKGMAIAYNLTGSGAKLAEKMERAYLLNKNEYDYPFWVRGQDEYITPHFIDIILESVYEYSRLSGDKKILSLFPKECKSCGRIITFDGDIYVDSDDKDEEKYTRLDNDGECTICGALVQENMLKPILKIYPLIRKFEEEKGKHILPRVS